MDVGRATFKEMEEENPDHYRFAAKSRVGELLIVAQDSGLLVDLNACIDVREVLEKVDNFEVMK